MAIDFKRFLSVAPHIMAARLPIIIRGRHGIGKSEVVYQIAASNGLDVIERRASQMTEGDLVGLPKINGETTAWNPPDWYKEACNRAVLLFLDEVDRATPEVRQGIFELTDSRKLNGHRLHPDTIVFAAINGGEHGSQYQVGEMDPAELDRYCTFDLEPSVEDWLNWANGKVNQIVWDFINQNQNHLEHRGDFEPNKVYPSRRSWYRFNKVCAPAKLFDGFSGELQAIAASIIGLEASIAFCEFVAHYDRQVTVEDIVDNGHLDKVKPFEIVDHSAMIEKIEASGKLEVELTANQVQNLVNYMELLPSECFMKLWHCVTRSGVKVDLKANIIAIHGATTSSGKTIKALVLEMMTGKVTNV